MKTPWNHPESCYDAHTDGEGKLHIKGQIVIDGVTCRFTLNQQGANSEYQLRGSMTLISPETGEPVVSVGEARKRALDRRKNKDDRPVEAKKAIFSNETKETEVKAYLIKSASDLIAENIPALESSYASIRVDPLHHSLSKLVLCHSTGFLNSKKLKASTFNSQKSSLKKAAAAFGLTPLSKIDVAKIKKAVSVSFVTQRQVKLLAEFWKYCTPICQLQNNPFAEYLRLSTVKKIKDGEKTAIDHATATNMFPQEEYELNRKLWRLLDVDSRMIALILAKDAGFGSKLASEVKWEDVLFDSENPMFVRIRLVKKLRGQSLIIPARCFLSLRSPYDTYMTIWWKPLEKTMWTPSMLCPMMEKRSRPQASLP